LCGNDDPAWSTTIEFKADGTFTAAMNLPKSNAPFPQSVGDGTWSLSESNIEMKFSTSIWTGKVFDTKMEGSLADNGTSCNGNWFLSKQRPLKFCKNLIELINYLLLVNAIIIKGHNKQLY
jgi:hypothetical protein